MDTFQIGKSKKNSLDTPIKTQVSLSWCEKLKQDTLSTIFLLADALIQRNLHF